MLLPYNVKIEFLVTIMYGIYVGLSYQQNVLDVNLEPKVCGRGLRLVFEKDKIGSNKNH